jgi:hypothetical protein
MQERPPLTQEKSTLVTALPVLLTGMSVNQSRTEVSDPPLLIVFSLPMGTRPAAA